MEDVSIGPSRQGKRLAQGNQQQEVGTSGDRGPVSFLQTEAGSRRLSRGANQALLLGPRCQVRALLWAWFPFPHCGHSDGVTTGWEERRGEFRAASRKMHIYPAAAHLQTDREGIVGPERVSFVRFGPKGRRGWGTRQPAV